MAYSLWQTPGIKKLLLSIAALTFLLVITLPANAAPLPQLIPAGCLERSAAECGLKEMLELGINVSRIILGLVGTVTLVMFIYGGFLWLTSAGRSDQIEKGRKVFTNSLIGLGLIFGSWLIINFAVAALTGQTPGSDVRVFPNKEQSAPVLQVPKTQ